MNQTELVRGVLRLLAGLGVRECCVAAGARNAPLIAALLASRGVRVRHFFEERCAGFFALGRVLDSGRPVAVVTTSGTAAAELLPAVIEAHYQALPLIALTADRPKHYRGSGAPQVIEQAGLFGPYVSACLDLDAAASLPEAAPLRRDRPLHVNVCLDEPLTTDLPGIDFEQAPPLAAAGAIPTEPADLSAFAAAERPVVLAAGLSPAEALRARPLLLALRAPVLAEATSNLWSPPAYDAALAPLLWPSSEENFHRLAPDHLLRLGCVPALRAWRDLEDRPDLPVLHFSHSGYAGLARKKGSLSLPWSSLPATAPACAAPLRDRAENAPVFQGETALLRALCDQFQPGSRVFLGNSLPIREVNQIIHPQPANVRFHANRGANGIDGLISTWLGLDAEAGGDSWLILGDLSALYDLAGPWILPQLEPRRRLLVVVNNGGGKIFQRVPCLRALPEPARAVIENRHRLSFRPLADMWGMSHQRIAQAEQFAALDGLPLGAHLIEIQADTRADA